MYFHNLGIHNFDRPFESMSTCILFQQKNPDFQFNVRVNKQVLSYQVFLCQANSSQKLLYCCYTGYSRLSEIYMNTVLLQELNVSRDTLEIGAQYSVARQDTHGFQRYMAQLQSYYYDYAGQISLIFVIRDLLLLDLSGFHFAQVCMQVGMSESFYFRSY